jgi:hypothetical protein
MRHPHGPKELVVLYNTRDRPVKASEARSGILGNQHFCFLGRSGMIHTPCTVCLGAIARKLGELKPWPLEGLSG